jgi:Ca-activated chloride channel family protein
MFDPAISCLRSVDGHPIPLLGVALSGEVFGAHAQISLRQRYRNDEKRPIEAIYTFPLPSDAVLVGFAMECAGRRIEGEVQEREEAFRRYDEAITKGHGAALLDQERRNVFTANVGNLLPGEETFVEVTYVQRLGAEEGALRLMIPTLVAPRYMPGSAAGDRTGHGTADPTTLVPDADRISPRIGDVNYGLSLDLLFDLGRPVTLECASHSVVVEETGKYQRRVTFRSATVPLDRDIVILATGAAGVAVGVVADRRPGEEGTFALTVVPDLFADAGGQRRASARDVVFVVDVSGSMGGTSIEQARSALRLCLRHLAEGDRFAIIAFSSTWSAFHESLVPFTQRTLESADQWVHDLTANGGTEMLAPLLAAVALLDSKLPRDRVVVLLTDGEVGNESMIVDRVVASAAGARVYTFGIGTNVSDLLVGDLARRTKGASELIHPGERIDDKVTAQFARATSPRVDDITVKFVGVDAGEVAPAELAALVDGEPWAIYGRYEEPGIGHAEIRGSFRGERFFLQVPVELPAEARRPGLGALWAGARIRDLEESERTLEGRRREAQHKRIVDLAVKHGIASKYTSFVVVEKRAGDRRARDLPEARPVPVNAPAGWAMQHGAMDGTRTRSGVMGINPQAPMPSFSQPSPMQAPARPGAGGRHVNRTIAAGRPMIPSPAGPAGARMAPPSSYAQQPGPMQSGGPPADGSDSEDRVRSPAKAKAPPPPPAPGRAASLDSFGAPQGAPPPSPGAYRPPPPPMMPPGGGSLERKVSASASHSPPKEEASPAAAAGVPLLKSAASAAEGEASRAARGGSPALDGKLFERQLASGLWEEGDSSDAGRLLATARALAMCHDAQIDTAHRLYGAQVRKAVEAICQLAADLATRGAAGREVMAALTASFLVASGPRLRREVMAIVEGSTLDSLKALAAHLNTREAARSKLLELSGI